MSSLAAIFAFGMPGGWEIALLIFAVLLLFGAKKIPELARGLGRGIREFKDATREISNEIENGTQEEKENKKTSSN